MLCPRRCLEKFLNEKERMGLSFKVAKTGTRYRPKLLQVEDEEIEKNPTTDSQQRENEGDLVGLGDKVTDYSNALAKPGLCLVSEVYPEVSFSLNLFPSGFSVGKPNELFNNVPRQLLPYDRASETLFSAIESGCLPGDVFDDLPCKYVNGALLCEIRDYRTNLSQKGDTSSSLENPLVIYKVVLQMCMENVVKDISSLSDDSWTYNDLLEFESRILKALQPDLHLDPKRMLEKLYEAPLAKKLLQLNLGICRHRKKRKLSDASAIERVVSNPSPRIQVSEVCVPWNSNFQSDIELAATYNQSLSGTLTPSNAVSAPKPNYGHSNTRIPKSLTTLGEKRRYGTLANRGPISKKPKQEPPDLSQEQLPESQAETKLTTELQRKNKLLHQRLEGERILHKRTHEKIHPSPSIKNVQQAIHEGIPKLKCEVPTSRVKEEPIEINSFPSLNAGNARDNSHIMDMRNYQPNLLQSQLLQPSGLVKAHVPANTMQWNHMGESIGKNMTNEVTQDQKGKALQHCQVSSNAVNASVPSHLSDSLPREASLPSKRKSNSCLKGLIINRAESLAGTSAMNTANAVGLPVGTPFPCLSAIDDLVLETPMPSEISDPVLDRLSKMKMITQRYALNNRKRKFSEVVGRRSFSCTTQLVAFHLMNSEDKNSIDGTTDITSHSDCSLESNSNIFKTRKFAFVHSSHVSQGNHIANSKAQIKLTILEKLDEGIVEATVAYDHEKFDPIMLRLLETFTNTHHADLFAAQFSSLMIGEGYRPAGDQIEPVPLVIDRCSTSQPQTVTSTVTPAAGSVELVPIPGKSPYIFNPIRSNTLAINPRQLTSENNFSGGHLLPYANIQSPLLLSAGYFSKPHEIASQISPMHPQWQHIINKRALLQLQMLQRDGLQQQLLQKRMMMMGRFGAVTDSLGSLQLDGEAKGHGNIGLGSYGNAVGIANSMSLLRGGNIQGIGSSGENNTLAAVLARMRLAENRGRALVSGSSINGSAGVAPTCPPNILGVTYHAINRQLPPMQMQPQLYMQQHQEMRSPLQAPEAISWTEHIGSPLSPSSLMQMEQQSQMSPQQISSVSVPQQMDSGKITVDHESPGLGSQAPGSVGSCSISSPMELHGLIEGGNAIQTGGIK